MKNVREFKCHVSYLERMLGYLSSDNLFSQSAQKFRYPEHTDDSRGLTCIAVHGFAANGGHSLLIIIIILNVKRSSVSLPTFSCVNMRKIVFFFPFC